MRVVLKRGELRSAVVGFGRVITGRNIRGVYGGVCLRCVGGRVSGTVTDTVQTLTYEFGAAEAGADGEVVLPLATLRELSRGGAQERVEFNLRDGIVTVVNQVKERYVTSRVDTLDSREWPACGAKIPAVRSEGFLAAYRRVAPFALQEESDRGLQHVAVSITADGVHNASLVATDGKRLCCCNSISLLGAGGAGTVLLPVSRFLLWSGLGDGAEVGIERNGDGGRVGVYAGPWSYQVLAGSGSYPDWRRLIPQDKSLVHSIVLGREDIAAVRSILPALIRQKVAVLEGSAGGALCIGGAGGGRRGFMTKLERGSRYTGSGCRVSVDAGFLQAALEAGFSSFAFVDALSPLVSRDDRGGVHLLMPLRYEGSSKAESSSASVEAEADGAAAGTDSVAAGVADTRVSPPVAGTGVAGVAAVAAAMVKAVTGSVPVSRDTGRTSGGSCATESGCVVESGSVEESRIEVKEAGMAGNINAGDVSALELLSAAYENARNKMREMQGSLNEMAATLRVAVREDKRRSSEMNTIRAGLAKLKAINIQ